MLKGSSKDKPIYAWGVVAGILVAMGSILVVQPLVGIALSFSTGALGLSPAQADEWANRPAVSFVTFLLVEGLAAAAIAWFVRLKKGDYFQAVGLRKPAWKDMGYGFVGFLTYLVLAAVATVALGPLLHDTTIKQSVGFQPGISGGALVMAFVSLVLLAPLVEEITFRGFLYGTLRSNGVRVGVSVLVTSLLFGALHVFTGVDGLLWSAGIDTFLLSVIACNVRERSGSIWGTILIHSLKNCLAFVGLFLNAVH